MPNPFEEKFKGPEDAEAWEALKAEALKRIADLADERDRVCDDTKMNEKDQDARLAEIDAQVEEILSNKELVRDVDFRERFDRLGSASYLYRIFEPTWPELADLERKARYRALITGNIPLFNGHDRVAIAKFIKSHELENNREFIMIAADAWGPSIFNYIGDEIKRDVSFWVDMMIANPLSSINFPQIHPGTHWRYDEEFKKLVLDRDPKLAEFF